MTEDRYLWHDREQPDLLDPISREPTERRRRPRWGMAPPPRSTTEMLPVAVLCWLSSRARCLKPLLSLPRRVDLRALKRIGCTAGRRSARPLERSCTTRGSPRRRRRFRLGTPSSAARRGARWTAPSGTICRSIRRRRRRTTRAPRRRRSPPPRRTCRIARGWRAGPRGRACRTARTPPRRRSRTPGERRRRERRGRRYAWRT